MSWLASPITTTITITFLQQQLLAPRLKGFLISPSSRLTAMSALGAPTSCRLQVIMRDLRRSCFPLRLLRLCD